MKQAYLKATEKFSMILEALANKQNARNKVEEEMCQLTKDSTTYAIIFKALEDLKGWGGRTLLFSNSVLAGEGLPTLQQIRTCLELNEWGDILCL